MAAQHVEQWTALENFSLACCVARNGDQNWYVINIVYMIVNIKSKFASI